MMLSIFEFASLARNFNFTVGSGIPVADTVHVYRGTHTCSLGVIGGLLRETIWGCEQNSRTKFLVAIVKTRTTEISHDLSRRTILARPESRLFENHSIVHFARLHLPPCSPLFSRWWDTER
jgi:hypothetical protein